NDKLSFKHIIVTLSNQPQCSRDRHSAYYNQNILHAIPFAVLLSSPILLLLFHRMSSPTFKADNRVTMLRHKISTTFTLLFIIYIATFRAFDVWTFIPFYPNKFTAFRTFSFIFMFSNK